MSNIEMMTVIVVVAVNAERDSESGSRIVSHILSRDDAIMDAKGEAKERFEDQEYSLSGLRFIMHETRMPVPREKEISTIIRAELPELTEDEATTIIATIA